MLCWGWTMAGALGRPWPQGDVGPALGISDAVQVAAGRDHSCALRRNGDVACWGQNEHGEVGDGTTTKRDTPVPVIRLAGATQVVAGMHHSCARLRSGAVSCWGNIPGQIRSAPRPGRSFGDIVNHSKPVPVGGAAGALRLAAGNSHVCAQLLGGRLACWGSFFPGDRDADQVSIHKRAVPLGGISNVAGVATGDSFTCALHGSGEVSCWGYGLSGELGHGKLEIRPRPVQVAGLADAVEIAAGHSFACARRKTGAVVCWGDNTHCQLGNSNGPFLLEATRVDELR